MQQPVKREDAQFGGLGVTGRTRLPPGDAAGDHDVAEEAIFVGIRDSGFGIRA